ncbi:MAG: thermonuclease family protein [Hyphomicrobiales bacterium]|nr:thermonuclease family protein [Hyphomicrobiales bacterium]MCP5374418.1 thermonuclease family protein [Hyphomicrobiales bacterium]
MRSLILAQTLAQTLVQTLALALALPLTASAAGEVIHGGRHEVMVIDGDSIQIGATVVQLAGIDAPEYGQTCHHGGGLRPCGHEAAEALHKIIDLTGATGIRCYPLGSSQAGAVVATCFAGREDLSRAMLQAGHAVTVRAGGPGFDPGSAPGYEADQQVARGAGLGIWGGAFTPPWQWRETATPDDETSHCPIRGVVDDGGRRVYTTPLDGADAQDDGDDVRWFCSDDEARAAGWRRPGEK